MHTLAISAPIVAALLVGCAAEVPPPPPAEPVVDGQVRSVSPSDIKTVVALAKKRLAETVRGSQPIYHVYVDRSDMITVSHGRLPTPHDKTEEFLIFDRIKGKWRLRDIEIVRGFNIPTS
jgi:hypothetical protein